MMESSYAEFLQQKVIDVPKSGFLVEDVDLHPGNYPHQNAIIRWAARMGRALIACSFGLGKTRVQCELARLIVFRTGGLFLVVCPLGVKHQFVDEDGPALDMEWQYVRTDAEIEAATTPYLITNYERVREGGIDPRKHNFTGVSLDEGAVLRSLGSKTYDVFDAAFADVPYRYVATATPSPNDYLELIHYAHFLDIMDRGQALTRFFKRDSSQAGHLTLYQQHEKDFWLWVASWAVFLDKPSDLGFSDEGYELPELRVHWHRLEVDHRRAFSQHDHRGQHRLILDAAAGVSESSAEKRETLPDRIAKMLEIMATDPDGHWLLWHHLEVERKAIEKAVPTAVTVYGQQTVEQKESGILGFARGEIKDFATKPDIAGEGSNLQRHCHSNIFLGVNYKFKDFIQAIHRTYRFQQPFPVDVHIIYAESEDRVVEALQRKWQQHDTLMENMRQIVKKYGLVQEAMRQELIRTIGVERREERGARFVAVNADCVAETERMADNSIDLIVSSIPFGNHYEYTVSYEDFGHNPTDDHFWRQMDFLTPNLLRILKPGRVACIHVKDRVLYGHQTRSGMPEIGPFSDECVMHFRKHGWLYEGRRTIVTDVVRENAGTYRLGWTEMTKDATKMGSGLPEYLLLFRKANSDHSTARADEPVTKTKDEYSRARWQVDAHSFWRSDGNTPLLPVELYDYEAHVARLETLDRAGNLPSSWMYEPPKSRHAWVWDDVVSMQTLNSKQAQKRLENHICPLPYDIVERAIRLYSNPGDLVLDPFGGLGTVPYLSIKLDRRAYAIELNSEYFGSLVGYCKEMEEEVLSPTLFDYLALANEPALSEP